MEFGKLKSMRETFVSDMESVGAGNLARSIVDKLTEMQFFHMPASKRYHGTEEGDLFQHSRNVATTLKGITERCGVEWANPRSPILVGYFHDLCKCDQYTWNVEESKWDSRKDQLIKGHGDKSVMIASTLCKLTEEEMLCIRYHMGAYNTDDWDEFDRAIRKHETVLWTHQADMIASKIVGV